MTLHLLTSHAVRGLESRTFSFDQALPVSFLFFFVPGLRGPDLKNRQQWLHFDKGRYSCEETPEVQPDQDCCHQQKSSSVSYFTTEKRECVIEIWASKQRRSLQVGYANSIQFLLNLKRYETTRSAPLCCVLNLVFVLSGFWCKCQWRPGRVWGFCGGGFRVWASSSVVKKWCPWCPQVDFGVEPVIACLWFMEIEHSVVQGRRRLPSEKEWSSVETSNILQPYLLLLPLRGSQQFQSFYTLPLSGQLCRQNCVVGRSVRWCNGEVRHFYSLHSFKRWWHSCQNPCQVFSEIQDELQAALEGEAAATWYTYCQ